NKRESEDVPDPSDGGLGRGVKKPRVEGRGSSAAQRAAASEACKGITLEALQGQYYRPLSDVAKDLRVSVARLLKKCREFGILRWPYRHVRSVQESIEQLERDREASTDPLAAEEMDLRLRLLRRRGELVIHFASCGLESDMRKGIFLADPRDVDAMIAKAHEAYGSRRPPQGWDSLGRFPDPMIREHFLEQMRAHMVGGGGMLSAPDSPLPPRGPFWTEGSGANALDDIRVDAGQHPHLRHPQHHPSSAQHPQIHRPPRTHSGGGSGGGGGGGGGSGRLHPSHWPQPHSHNQHSWQPEPPQRPLYPQQRDVEHPGPIGNYQDPYWSPPASAGTMAGGGGGGSGLARGTGAAVSPSEFNRIRQPGRAEYPPSSEATGSSSYPFIGQPATSTSGQPLQHQQPGPLVSSPPSRSGGHGHSASSATTGGGGSYMHAVGTQHRTDQWDSGGGVPEGWASAAGSGG
ncbi:unnamed protein product, partial [Sphacelaria rigidula]